MRVAVSSSGKDLESPVDPRFGRCAYFVIIDTERMEFEAFPNSNVGTPHGAGIGAAQLVASKGVRIVLTGNVGPNAFGCLSAAGVQVVSGTVGRVKDAVEKFKRGELTADVGPTVGGHFGTGGVGMGLGRGGRRGLEAPL